MSIRYYPNESCRDSRSVETTNIRKRVRPLRGRRQRGSIVSTDVWPQWGRKCLFCTFFRIWNGYFPLPYPADCCSGTPCTPTRTWFH